MNLIELNRALRQLRLGGIAAVLETRIHQAQAEAMPPIDFLSCLVSDELTRRGDRLLERRTKQAEFRDPQRSLDNFDFNFNNERGIGGPKMVHAACWAHPRRRFVDAVKLNRQDAAAIRAVKLMDELFAIDREASEAQMDHAARHRLRREKAPPLLDQIREHILATSKTVLPKSAVGIACSYTLALWKKVACFLGHPQRDLAKNLAETYMRPRSIGSKSRIHIGSEQAGPRVAAIMSVVESCRRLKISV